MPQAIAVAIVGYIGVTGTAAAIATAAISAAITVGISIGVSMLAQSLMGQKTPKPSDRQFMIRSSVSPRVRHYGRVRTGGTQVYATAVDGKFYRVLAHGHGQIDGIEKFYLDGKEVAVGSDGFVTDDKYQHGGRSRVKIETRDGGADPAHYANLGAAAAVWNSDHLGRGVFHSLTTFEQVPQSKFLDMFPSAENTVFNVLFRDSDVEDPRSSTVAWSENSALCVLDVLAHPDIFAIPRDWIDLAALSAAANHCDTEIPLAAGGTEPRYRTSASYFYDQRPADFLAAMLAGCNGKFLYGEGGRLALDVGVWTEPEFVVDASMIESYTLDGGNEGPDTSNVIRAAYVSPEHGYTEQDADPWENAADVALRGAKVGDVPLLTVPSHSQARRLMKQAAALAAPKWRGTLSCSLAALPVLSYRFVRISLSDIGLEFTAEIDGTELRIADGNVLTGVTMSFVSMDQAAFDWVPDEEGRAPEVPPVEDDSVIVSPPSDVVVAIEYRTTGGPHHVAVISWGEVPDYVYVEVQAQINGSDTWTALVMGEAGALSAETPPLINGATYAMRARSVSLSRTSEWISIGTFAIDAPTAATALSVGVVTDDATVAWTQPASASADAARVYRGTTSGSATATLIATVSGGPSVVLSYIDSDLAAGTYWWWVEAINASGVGAGRVLAGTATV